MPVSLKETMLKPRIKKNTQWPAMWSVSLQLGHYVIHAGGMSPTEAYRRFVSNPIVSFRART